MKQFGGPTIFLDRDDINTDEIIPAKYLTENSKKDLKPYMLEDLKLEGFDPSSPELERAKVIIARGNFGCGSSREHAVWVFEVNDINMVVGEGFARIFRQNMFNCGMLAVELPKADIDAISALGQNLEIEVDLENSSLLARSESNGKQQNFTFQLNTFDKELITAGGWLAYADQKY